MQFLIFRLYGRFAHFSDPLTSPRYTKRTYQIIPKPTIFGIIGSLIGLDGYSRFKVPISEKGQTLLTEKYKYKYPQFYELLKNKRIFIIPQGLPFKKIIVDYNSINSFASNTNMKEAVLNMHEEILMDVDYIIGIEFDENSDIDKKILRRVKNNTSFYHIYLGKNEFFANIEYICFKEAQPFNSFEYSVTIKSIFPLEDVEYDYIFRDVWINGFYIDNEMNTIRPKMVKIAYSNEQIKLIKKSDATYISVDDDILCLL